MKKLLITTMAAVSVGLCAKAEYDGTKTSFEDYEPGSTLIVNDKNDLSWTSSATDPLFVISNKTDFANWTKPSRPDYWATSSDEKALTIDTDAPLFCHVNNRNTSYDFSDGPIFFDSVVQFTATDVAAEPDSDDKLRVWLYSSPEDVATTPGLFNETTPKKCLVVTAGSYDGEDGLMGNLTHQHYEITGIDVQPDTWHRLTIKAIADINASEIFNTPGFEIWVDGTPVTYGEKTQFPSLKRAVANETLQCVAFDGKGAVDDIVFTTTPPEFAREEEEVVETYSIAYNVVNAVEGTSVQFFTDKDSVYPVPDIAKIDVAVDTIFAYVMIPANATLSSVALNGTNLTIPTADNLITTKGYNFELSLGTPTANASYTLVVTLANSASGSGDKPTIGGAEVAAGDVVNPDKVNSSTEIELPNGWTVDGNQIKEGDTVFAEFPSYYTVTFAGGKVTLALNDTVKPVIAESKDGDDTVKPMEFAKDGDKDVVKINVSNRDSNLFYGIKAAATITGLNAATPEWAAIRGANPPAAAKTGDAQFFKVVVTDVK